MPHRHPLRHCEERSDAAIQIIKSVAAGDNRLLLSDFAATSPVIARRNGESWELCHLFVIIPKR